ncbi:ImmA/IrrE family metallo-endopeptidase [Natroniella acetigena]|uniref:ImmA/IrrE family metallo-endopeptidase n=1 Tax=Natroniella acetigena TaxID=52004 RepID=UPI00200A3047|nr:ImmA/IrrE family metallo-endopeptidase [Natroniella acetigena]MCK8827127.1 ImmA/IrrE family metallo-endopeptidase [Natroniella acetigena]
MTNQKEAQQIAKQFLETHNLNFPINIKKIVNILDIKLIYCNFEGKGTVFYADKNQRLIFANNNLSDEKLRFEITINIAHILLDNHGLIFEGYSAPSSDLSAKACARELLLPETEVKKIAQKYNGSTQKIKNHFKVPRELVIQQIENLNLTYTIEE